MTAINIKVTLWCNKKLINKAKSEKLNLSSLLNEALKQELWNRYLEELDCLE